MNRIRVQIDQDRKKNRDRWQEVATARLLVTYQELSDNELERNAEFLESDVGQGFHLLATSALKDALYESNEAMSPGLASVFRTTGG